MLISSACLAWRSNLQTFLFLSTFILVLYSVLYSFVFICFHLFSAMCSFSHPSLPLSLPTLLFSLSHTLFPSHTHSHSNETPAPVPSTERRLTHFAFVSEFHNQLHTKPQLN